MFQLTKDECSKSQIATLNVKRGYNLKKLPYAFTEQGVAMLSSVLRSKTAIDVNIRIMRAFVSMRHFMASNTTIFQRFETLVRCLNFHPDAVKNTSGMSLELHPRCH